MENIHDESLIHCGDFLRQYVPKQFLELADPTLIVISKDEKFAKYSPSRARAIAQGHISEDDSRTNGLYDSGIDTVIIRKVSPGTVVHEFGHALDHALARLEKLNYHFASEMYFHNEFRSAKKFISWYARTNVVEFFAENFRMYCGAFNEKEKYGVAGNLILANRHPHSYNFFSRIEDGSWFK